LKPHELALSASAPRTTAAEVSATVAAGSAANEPTSRSRLPRRKLAAFAALTLPVTAAQVPMAVYLPALYAQYFGISLAALGAIFLAERIWGAAADPIIGILSDRTKSRFGRRKSWIAGGAVLYALATVFLFFPTLPFVRVTPLGLTVTLFAFYLSWSMIQIPYLAWSGEVSSEYHERTRIAMSQAVAAAISLLLILVLPTIIDQISPKDAPLKLGAMGGVILLSLPVTLLFTLRAVPEPVVPPEPARLPLTTALRLILREGALVRVFFSDFAVSAAQGCRGVLFVFFVTDYMGLPKWASGLFLLQFIFGIGASPIWAAIARRFGKHRTAVIGELVQVAINLGLLLVVPGHLALLLALTVAQGLAQGSGNLMLRSMVADVADHHRLETGTDRTALFFSVFSISMKTGLAVATGIALPLVAWLGFDPAAKVNSPEALHGLLFVFALGPALAHLISTTLIYNFPIDEARHAEILDALEAQIFHDPMNANQ
jgi:GPH family glycoside/pentoside/hexuronide:cation symporter